MIDIVIQFSFFCLRQGGYIFTLFLYLLAGLCKNYLTDVHKIQLIGGTWTKEETIGLWC